MPAHTLRRGFPCRDKESPAILQASSVGFGVFCCFVVVGVFFLNKQRLGAKFPPPAWGCPRRSIPPRWRSQGRGGTTTSAAFPTVAFYEVIRGSVLSPLRVGKRLCLPPSPNPNRGLLKKNNAHFKLVSGFLPYFVFFYFYFLFFCPPMNNIFSISPATQPPKTTIRKRKQESIPPAKHVLGTGWNNNNKKY